MSEPQSQLDTFTPLRKKLNSRKLLVTLLGISAATGLVATGKIAGADWVSAMQLIIPAYLATQAWVDRS